MGSLFAILINVLIFCLIAGVLLLVIRWAVSYLGLPDIILKVCVVLVVVVVLLWLLGAMTGQVPYIYRFH